MADAQGEVPPIQHVPSAKEKKYDRQLRLWAAAGQQALEEAHILLINSGPGAAGIEALKNLILPGIGHFTIQDSSIVSEADLGINFFLEESSVGRLRAEETLKYLSELNPDVQGHAIAEPLATWITSDDALTPYTLIVVASPIHPDTLYRVSSYAQKSLVPVFYTHSVGFYSHFSVILPPAFPIVDTHPDPKSTEDLRLLQPWPELITFAREKSTGITSSSGYERAHVPYVVLLLHYLEQWKVTHDGKPPLTYQEKTAFREYVRSEGPPMEENYEEACSAVLKTLNMPTLASAVLKVLSAPEASTLSSRSDPFWYIASAVASFAQTHNQLPLPGSLPDMKAQSQDYITLQNIYKSKARSDVAEVLSTVRQLEQQHGRKQAIPQGEVEQFCKLAAHIKLLRGSPTPILLPQNAINWTTEAGTSVVNSLPNADFGIESSVPLYIAFVAYDAFLASHISDLGAEMRAPGEVADVKHVAEDAEKLTGIAHKVFDEAIKAGGTRVENPQYDAVREELRKICVELTRAAGGELHNIASLTGGMVAQEIIKVITRQYVPADNTCVFDGVVSKVGVYRI